VSRFDRPVVRIALLAALLVATGLLSACGRKGPLDPPALAPQSSDLQFDADGKPIAPAGPTRRIPLDVLLD
jgi:predicted small lipoprotein YifL